MKENGAINILTLAIQANKALFYTCVKFTCVCVRACSRVTSHACRVILHELMRVKQAYVRVTRTRIIPCI